MPGVLRESRTKIEAQPDDRLTDTRDMDRKNARYQRAALILTDDRARLHECLGRTLAATYDVHYAPVHAELCLVRVLAPRLELAFVHAVHPDDDVVDGLQRIRLLAPSCRCVIATDIVSARIINAAPYHRAECIALGDTPEGVEYVARGLALDDVFAALHRESTIASLFARYRLTARQRAVAWMAVAGMRRDEMAVRLGVSCNTVKTHARRLLQRSGASRLSDLIDRA